MSLERRKFKNSTEKSYKLQLVEILKLRIEILKLRIEIFKFNVKILHLD